MKIFQVHLKSMSILLLLVELFCINLFLSVRSSWCSSLLYYCWFYFLRARGGLVALSITERRAFERSIIIIEFSISPFIYISFYIIWCAGYWFIAPQFQFNFLSWSVEIDLSPLNVLFCPAGTEALCSSRPWSNTVEGKNFASRGGCACLAAFCIIPGFF